MAGQIKGITIEFDGKTTKLEQAIKRVKNSTNDVDKALKDVNRGLKFDPKNVTLLSQKQELLTKRVEESKEKVKQLKDAQAQLDAKEVDKTSMEYQELEREIVKAEAEQKRFEKELRQLSSVKLTALGEQFKQIGGKMMDVGKTMSMYVTAPLTAVGVAGAKSFAEVDKTMQLTNSTMGNTAEQAEMLNQAMKDAAANSTYGMSDAATATLNFARAGLTAEQAASALAPAMNLAAGEGGNLDTVSAGLVATINGFGGSFDDAAAYADVFANACNNSALDIDSLASSMSVAAPIFSAAGYSVNDAALYMGVMANKGIEASVAANSLKTGFARLVGGSADVQAQLDALGVSIVNADGSMKDTVTIQKELHDAFAGLSESEQIAAASTIFGKNQMASWLALINTAPGDVNALSAALDEEGTTAEMAEAMMSGFGGSLEKLKSSVDVAKTSLGEALAPIILKVAEGIQKLVCPMLDGDSSWLLKEILKTFEVDVSYMDEEEYAGCMAKKFDSIKYHTEIPDEAKTGEKLSGNYKYLQIRYTLTDTGRVIRRINPKNITRERRKLKAYKRLLDKGKMPAEDIEEAFKSWLGSCYKYMSNQQIINMLTLYQDLFRRELKWRKQSRLRWLTEQSSKISD